MNETESKRNPTSFDMDNLTPGPWHVEPTQADHGETNSIVSADHTRLATVFAEDKTDEANARLMAATPDLLAALTAILDGWDNWAERGKIEAALESAERLIRKFERN